MSDRCGESKVVLLIGLLASLIGIFAFMTGLDSCQAVRVRAEQSARQTPRISTSLAPSVSHTVVRNPETRTGGTVEVFRHSGTITDNVTFDDLIISVHGNMVNVEFDYTMRSHNPTELDQLLVSANGRVVGFVFDGMVGNGKSGHAALAFNPRDYTTGRCNIEIGWCADYTTAQAKQSYENPQKGGYRLEVGYVE